MVFKLILVDVRMIMLVELIDPWVSILLTTGSLRHSLRNTGSKASMNSSASGHSKSGKEIHETIFVKLKAGFFVLVAIAVNIMLICVLLDMTSKNGFRVEFKLIEGITCWRFFPRHTHAASALDGIPLQLFYRSIFVMR